MTTSFPSPLAIPADRLWQSFSGLWLTLVLLAFSALGANAQVINSFTPTQGQPGTQVTISGSGFTGASGVTFNGQAAAFFAQDDQTIITQVPVGASTGPISVTVGGNTATSTGIFTVDAAIPSITTFTPVSGTVGSNVNITGVNLNVVDSITFANNVRATVTPVSATSVIVVVPAGAVTGPITLHYQGNTYPSANPFTITAGVPQVNGFTPNTGPTGTTVTITGSNFVAPISVSFNNAQATTINLINSTTLEAVVPGNATTGLIRVTTAGGTGISRGQFQVTNPTVPVITFFNPIQGPVGTAVTINGQSLGNATTVLFNGVQAVINTNTATTITTAVPVGATTGPITVITANGTAISQNNFTVTTPGATICAVNPQNANIMNIGPNWTAAQAAPAGRTYQYTFNAQAGTTYSFRACTPGAVLRVYNFQNQELAFADVQGPHCTRGGASLDFVPSITGVHRVILTSAPCDPLTVVTTLEYRAVQLPAAPVINSFTPVSGIVGTNVSISGFNLNLVTSLRLNGTVCPINAQTTTSINTTIPAGATTGVFQASYSLGVVNSADTFTVLTNANTMCLPTASLRGTLTFTNNWQSSASVNGIGAYWTFTATAGTTYSFSTCGTTANTRMIIYNNTTLVAVDSADDNGPACVGTAASMEFKPTVGGTYRILVVESNCGPLSAATQLRYKQGAVLQITGFSPSSGPEGVAVVLRGYGFVGGVTALSLGNVPVTNYTIVNDTVINLVIPVGAMTDFFRITAGNRQAVATDMFTVTSIPTMCGPIAFGGAIYPVLTPRVITGTAGTRAAYVFNTTQNSTYQFSTCAGNTGNTKIRVYNAAGNVVADNDDNGPVCNPSLLASLNFVAPFTGEFFVLVTDSDCDVLAANTDLTYQLLNATVPPTITSFTPAAGPIGSTVSITGRYFTGASTVIFNNTTASNFAVVSDTLITATVAAGTTTGPIRVTTNYGTGTSSTNFDVITCTQNINANLVSLGGGNFSFTVLAGPGVVYTYELDGRPISTNANFPVTVGPHVVRVTNATTRCFREIAFRYMGPVACDSRISGTGIGPDSVSFYDYPLPARGQSSIVIFDDATAPALARMRGANGTVAQIQTGAANSTNLSFTYNNQPLGTVVPLEVQTRGGQPFGAWVNCPVVTTTLQNMSSNNITNCDATVTLPNFPQRYTVQGRLITTLTPAIANRAVELKLVSFNIDPTDTLYVYNGQSASAANFLAKLTGNYSANSNYIFTSTAATGNLTLVWEGPSRTRAGFIGKVSCVDNSVPRISVTAPTSTALCQGSNISIPYSLNAAFVLPVSLSLELSALGGSFASPTVLSTGTASTSTGTATGVIPASTAPGSYAVRITGGSAVSDVFNITVAAPPAEPSITAQGNTTICPGSSVRLSASGGNNNYLWSTGVVGNSITITTPGTYTVRVVSGSCTSAASAPVVVTAVSIATPVVTQRNDSLFVATQPGATYQWFINGGQIPGATDPSYRPLIPGQYAVSVSISGCNLLSNVVTVTSLASSQAGSLVSLYPNPASEVAMLQAPAELWNQFKLVRISTVVGSIVREQETAGNNAGVVELNLRGLSAGTYLIQVPGTTFRKTLVVR